MFKLVIIPDLHLQNKKIYMKAQSQFINWFCAQDFNNENNIFLSLGDFFESKIIYPDVISQAIDFLQNRCKFKEMLILSGNNNHEYNFHKKTWAIQSLENLERIKIVLKPEQIKIDNLSISLLPWMPDYFLNKKLKMKDYYLTEQKEDDYFFTHLNTEESYFNDFIDLKSKFLNTRLVSGHIHSKNLGICIPQNYGERNFTGKVMIIDTETKEESFIEIPRFIKFDTLEYPEIKKVDLNKENIIFDIDNAPDKNTAIDFYTKEYGDYFQYRQINLKKSYNKNDKTISLQEQTSESAKMTMFEGFCSENEISENNKKRLREIILKDA